MPRDAFTDIDPDLVVDIIRIQSKLAIARYKAWHKGVGFPVGKFTKEIHDVLEKVRLDRIIKKELRDIHKYEISLMEEHAISRTLCDEAVKLLESIEERMPDFAPAVTNSKNILKFNKAIDEYDFDTAIRWWGLITYEMDSLRRRLELNPDSDKNKEIREFFDLPQTQLFMGIASGMNRVFNSYIMAEGIYNSEGQEYGKAIGRVRVVEEVDRIEEEFQKAKGDEIWVIPYLPFKGPDIPGVGCIISIAGNRHAIDTAAQQAIPLAVIPNAIQLLKNFDGEIGMLRVEPDADVRFRRAFPGEEGIPREKKHYSVKLPEARFGKKLVYRLNDVDDNFVNFVGPKAANLGKIINARINVPEGVVLAYAVWDIFKTHNRLDEKIAAIRAKIKTEGTKVAIRETELRTLLEEIKDVIISGEFSEEAEREILSYVNEMRSRHGNVGF